MNDEEVLTHLEKLYDDGKSPDDGVRFLAIHCTREQADRVVGKKIHNLKKELGI